MADSATDEQAHVIRYDTTQGLVIGTLVPCHQIYRETQVLAHYPCLAMVAKLVDSACPTGRSSLGCQVSAETPHNEALAALIVLGAMCVVSGPRGERTVPLVDFYETDGRETLRSDEHLVALHLPAPRAASGAWYIPFHPGYGRALVYFRIAAGLTLSEDLGVIEQACIAVGGATGNPRRVAEVAAVLCGQPPTAPVFNAAGAVARLVVADTEGRSEWSAEKGRLVSLLTVRALRVACGQATSVATGAEVSERV